MFFAFDFGGRTLSTPWINTATSSIKELMAQQWLMGRYI
jgi:hypothetical protein